MFLQGAIYPIVYLGDGEADQSAKIKMSLGTIHHDY